MDEDYILERALEWHLLRGWLTAYRTRPVSEGAIGGVDAILLKRSPWRFVFIDAKGGMLTKEGKSLGFTNCLGALVKRIRFEAGYRGVEAADRFTTCEELGAAAVRELIGGSATHRHSEYVLALPSHLRQTVKFSLDPALASLLHIRVLLISDAGAEEMAW